MIALHYEDVRATILPEIGGSLGSLSWRGIDLLRPAPAGCTDVKQTACFPLVPFANRIAHGRFRFDGLDVQLAGSGGDEPHSLHGTGWHSTWEVADKVADRVTLRLSHSDEHWPWLFEAQQVYQLLECGIRIELAITNTEVCDMPAGLGLHPYFVRTATSRLKGCVEGAWHPDFEGLATVWQEEPIANQLATGVEVASLIGLDSCCGNWKGELLIQCEQVDMAVKAIPVTPCLHIYVPENERFFCVEPVTHSPDAINRSSEFPMTRLRPGEAMRIGVIIQATPNP